MAMRIVVIVFLVAIVASLASALVFLFRDQGEVDHVRSKVDAEFRAGFEPTGLVALGFAGAGFAYLMGTRPLGSREELIATKVWAPQADVYAQVTFQAGGIQPIVLPITSGGNFARTAGFAVSLVGAGTATTGVVRCDQPRVLDLAARTARKVDTLPAPILDEVLAKVATLFQ